MELSEYTADISGYDSSFYDTLNQGVHRAAAPPLGSPALVWHLALWRNPPVVEGIGKAIWPHLDVIRLSILNIANRAANFSGEDKIFTNSGFIKGERFGLNISQDDIEKPENRGSLQFVWHGIMTNIDFEVHSEYTTITIRIDLEIKSNCCLKCQKDKNCPEIYLSEFFDTFDKILQKTSRKYVRVYDHLYFVVWKTFSREILGDIEGIGEIGKIFTDLRGIFTTSNDGIIRSGKNQVSQDHRIIPEHFRTKRYARGVAHKYGKPSAASDNDPTNENNEQANWARQWIALAWPMIKNAGADNGIEYTASTLLRGRSILVSSMGGRLRRLRRYDRIEPWNLQNHNPIIFYAHSYSDDIFQNGRLVDRILQAATMRLASLVDVEKLRVAGQKIAEVEESIFLGRTALDEHVRFKAIVDRESQNFEYTNFYKPEWVSYFTAHYWKGDKSRLGARDYFVIAQVARERLGMGLARRHNFLVAPDSRI